LANSCSVVFVSDSNEKVSANIKEYKNTGTSCVGNVSTSLVASKTGAHWTLDLIDVLTVFAMIEQEPGETSASCITLDREACAGGVELVNSVLEKSHFVGAVLWVSANMAKSLINIFSHGEAFCELSSNTVLPIVENSFR